MPYTLLHWNHGNVTYSVRRLPNRRGWLMATGPGARVRNGRAEVSAATVEAWRHMSEIERTEQAERMLAPSAGVPEQGPDLRG